MTGPDRRTLLAAGSAALVAGPSAAAGPTWGSMPGANTLPGGPANHWYAIALEVKRDFAWAWAAYADRALGWDQIKPVSGQGEHFFFENGPSIGLSAVEALGTLYVMGLDRELEQAVRWICDHLSFDLDREIQLFECNIRMVGGLLSGWQATGEKKLLALAHDLANRLMPAFNSPTGLPYRYVNLKTGAVRDGVTFPAEFGSYAPELGTLSRAVNDRRYFAAAKAAAKAGFDRRSRIGLVADTIDVRTGEWKSRRASVGPPTDSYYEYLWDGWQLFEDKDFKHWFDVHTDAVLKHQSDRVDGRLWFAQVDFETGQRLDRRQSELAAFYAGLLAQGGHWPEARAYLASWSAVQNTFGVLPEGFDYEHFAATRTTNALRPEFVDSCLNLYLLDPSDHWRELGLTHYRNMQKTSRAKYGFSGIADIMTTPMRQDDDCPGYWWSEQMKYYWLLFSDTRRFDYKRNYLSTEGDILQGFKHRR